MRSAPATVASGAPVPAVHGLGLTDAGYADAAADIDSLIRTGRPLTPVNLEGQP